MTLPWIGLDPVRLLTGVDLGAGFQLSYLLLAAAVLLAVGTTGPRRLAQGWRCARPWPAVMVAAMSALALSAIGLFAVTPGVDPGLGPRLARYAKQCLQLVVMLFFVGFPFYWTRGRQRWEATRRLFAIALLIQVVYGVLQGAAFGRAPGWFVALERVATSNPAILSGSEELYLGHGFTGIPRLRGMACEPLYLGNYLLLALPLVLMPGARRWHWLVGGAGGVLLLLTWSRGAWLAAGVAAVTWNILRWRGASRARGPRRHGGIEGRRRRWLWGAAVAVALIAVVWRRPDLAELPIRRLAQSLSRDDWSNLTRFYSMQAAWRAFLLGPVVGVGWGQFGFHFSALVDPTGLQSQFNWPVVNNFPLEIVCETGLIGFLVLAATATLLGRSVWRASGMDAAERGRLAVVAAAVAAVWAQMLTFSQYNLPHIWVAVGLLLAALRETETSRA